MVAADDQRAKRLWNLFQSHADGGEHVVVIDRHLGLMFEAQHPVAKVGEDSAIVLENRFLLEARQWLRGAKRLHRHVR